MATVRGRDQVKSFLAGIRAGVSTKLLPGAARASAKVIAGEAADRCISSHVRGDIKVRVRKRDAGVVRGAVEVEGDHAYIGRFLEYGTDPHFITVDQKLSRGRTAGRINDQVRDGDVKPEGTLLIDGKPVGDTVYHPGAKAHPFMRPALDAREADAIAAAQRYIAARVTPAGIVGGEEGVDE